MHEVDIPIYTGEQGTDKYGSEDSSYVFRAKLQKEILLDYKEAFIKITRNSHNMFGKPCIPCFPFHPLVLRSARYL